MAARRNRHGRRRNRGRFGFLYKLLSALLIFAALLVGCVVFFRVNTVVVSGNSRYAEAEVIQSSGVEQGDNLFALNKYQISRQIYTQLPYVDEVSIHRKLPDTLLIQVTESYPVAALCAGGEYWLLDARCKLLERGDASLAQGKAEVLGLTPLAPAVGTPLAVDQSQQDKLASLKSLLSAIQAQPPDAVLLAGDMADDSRGDAGVDALMSALGGAYPCCYVSGNHEVRTGCLEALKRRFRSWGITVLEGSGTLLATPGGTLRICGVDDPSAFAGESGWLEQFRACQALTGDSRYTVLLSHRPERTECYRDSGFDLVVSGHAHGGQVRLPGMINGLFAPHQGAFPDYAGGLYALGSTTLVVSRGLCRNLLPRVFNPPELVALDLLPAEDKAL